MNPSKHHAPSCREVQESVRRQWFRGVDWKDAELEHLLGECSDCYDDARALHVLDDQLRQSFRGVEESLPAPSEERLQDTLTRLYEEPVDAVTLRRTRLGVRRVLLWGALYGGLVLAAGAMIMLYRVVKGMSESLP